MPFVRKLKLGAFVLIVGLALVTCEDLLEVGKFVGMNEGTRGGTNVGQQVGRAVGEAVRKVGETVGIEERFERGQKVGEPDGVNVA